MKSNRQGPIMQGLRSQGKKFGFYYKGSAVPLKGVRLERNLVVPFRFRMVNEMESKAKLGRL